MQLIGSSSSHPVVHNRIDDTVTTSNQTTGSQLYSMPPPNLFGGGPPKVLLGTGTNILNGGGVQILGNTSTHIGGQNAPMLIPLNRFPQYPQVRLDAPKLLS